MNYLLLTFALAHLGLLAYSFRNGELNSARLWFLRAMLFAMAYDNILQGIGSWTIDAGWYEMASVQRFFLHAVVLPFLTPFTVSIMAAAAIGVAGRFWFIAATWLFTLAALGWGLYHEVFLLELGPKTVFGIEKLSSTSSVPPIATILTNIVILPMAAMVWRASGWRWFFLGALFIFLVNGATGALPWGFVAGNTAELIFIIALLATHWHFGSTGSAVDLAETEHRITGQ